MHIPSEVGDDGGGHLCPCRGDIQQSVIFSANEDPVTCSREGRGGFIRNYWETGGSCQSGEKPGFGAETQLAALLSITPCP